LTLFLCAGKRGIGSISFPPAFIPAESAVSDATIAVSNNVRRIDSMAPQTGSKLRSRPRAMSHQPQVVEVHASGFSAAALDTRAWWELAPARLDQPQARGGDGSTRDPLAVAARVALDPPTVTAGMACHESMLRSRQPYASYISIKRWR
jgi:hypothetical protein